MTSLLCDVQAVGVASKAATQSGGAVSSQGTQPPLQTTETAKEPAATFSPVGGKFLVILGHLGLNGNITIHSTLLPCFHASLLPLLFLSLYPLSLPS